MSIDKPGNDDRPLEIDYLPAFGVVSDTGDPFSEEGDVPLLDRSREDVDDPGVLHDDVGRFFSESHRDNVANLHTASSTVTPSAFRLESPLRIVPSAYSWESSSAESSRLRSRARPMAAKTFPPKCPSRKTRIAASVVPPGEVTFRRSSAGLSCRA